MKNIFAGLASLLFLISVAHPQDITETRFQLTKVVVVDATVGWTTTAIDLQVNDKVDIRVAGIASSEWKSNKQTTAWYGPDGNGSAGTGHPFPSAGGWAVIGKLGDSGSPFLVGSIKSFTVNKAGTLFLGYNDNGLGDNFGYFVAFISIVRNGVVVTAKVESAGENHPESFQLEQNYPNPFNPSTTIQYTLPRNENVEIRIYNASGQLVKTFANGVKGAGEYTTIWDGRDEAGNSVSSGAYFYQVKAGEFLQAKKMLLLK
jgi:hypothetical protein